MRSLGNACGYHVISHTYSSASFVGNQVRLLARKTEAELFKNETGFQKQVFKWVLVAGKKHFNGSSHGRVRSVVE